MSSFHTYYTIVVTNSLSDKNWTHCPLYIKLIEQVFRASPTLIDSTRTVFVAIRPFRKRGIQSVLHKIRNSNFTTTSLTYIYMYTSVIRNDLPANGRDADRRTRKAETPEQRDDRLKKRRYNSINFVDVHHAAICLLFLQLSQKNCHLCC